MSVLVRVENGVGRLTLNRPKALHALTTDMCAAMSEALAAWAVDPEIRLVMVDHAEGTRGFCAGGDIRRVAESGRGDGTAGEAFFAIEYRLNTQIKRFPKPYITLMDGVTMGGGVGISIHGSHRIATENTLFAMPETAIGLFPDVGGGWFLPRLSGELGTWLALTGTRLKGMDVLAAGIATHFVPSDQIAQLKQTIIAGEDFAAALSQPPLPPSYGAHVSLINHCFAGDSIADIAQMLKASGDDWATAQAEILATRSPLSLAVSLTQLRKGRAMTSFEDVMRMEYRIACHIIRSHDFSEGVRAVIEDKDNAPNWLPAADVTPAVVEAMFAPVAAELKLN